MNNEEKFKKILEKTEAPEDLKRKTIQKITEKPTRKIQPVFKLVAVCCVAVLCFSVGTLYLNKKKTNTNEPTIAQVTQLEEDEIELQRFKNKKEFIEKYSENTTRYYDTKGEILTFTSEDFSIDASNSARYEPNGSDSSTSIDSSKSTSQSSTDYSTTNVQVEDVDEADIIKTDGENIYYVTNGVLFIIDANSLEILSTISQDSDSKFSIKEIFVNNDKLVLFSSGYDNSITTNSTNYYSSNKELTQVTVYDISNTKKIKQERKIEIDGRYLESRMIDDNIYFVSRKDIYNYYYNEEDFEDDIILPTVKDTYQESGKTVEYTDIICCPHISSKSFTLVSGFNLNSKDEVNTETIFGASDTIYANQTNMYITSTNYSYSAFENTKTNIFKFRLRNSKITAVAEGDIKGRVLNQFALDEYQGNLRIATTYTGILGSDLNRVLVLNQNLEEIGRSDALAVDETIKSVRFVGKTAYVVTFEQIDPFFVLDMSNPEEPIVKGELKIPGYSSYLYPYDDTHIIGIGYNTEENTYGSIRTTTLKMSMFDVSDLENPTELFNISIGNDYASSDILTNHKALFYNKNENLIGFPLTTRVENSEDEDYYSYKTEPIFNIYHIDLEKNQFTEYASLKVENRSTAYKINRAIYIGDKIYLMTANTIEKLDYKKLESEAIIDLELETNEKDIIIIE